MGKKRIIPKSEEKREGSKTNEPKKEGATPLASGGESFVSQPAQGLGKGRYMRGIAHIRASYNNTMITITDEQGGAVAASSAGALGFSGAKKATPFAAARVSEVVVEKMKKSGIQEVIVEVSGVGSGRDSAIRSLANHGLNIIHIKDVTPIPHNGPRPKKVRRV